MTVCQLGNITGGSSRSTFAFLDVVVHPRPAAHELDAPALVPHLGAGGRVIARKSFETYMVRPESQQGQT